MYEAVTRGTVDYLTGTLARRATPADIGLDVLTWIQETTRSKSPRWATEHTVLAEWPIARLRDFYVQFFGARPGPPYANPAHAFESCFLEFDGGA